MYYRQNRSYTEISCSYTEISCSYTEISCSYTPRAHWWKWVEVGSSRRSLRCGMRFTLPRPGAGPMTRASHAFQSRNRICRSYLQRPCTRLHLHGPACQLRVTTCNCEGPNVTAFLNVTARGKEWTRLRREVEKQRVTSHQLQPRRDFRLIWDNSGPNLCPEFSPPFWGQFSRCFSVRAERLRTRPALG
jgi:hypothetical protein